MVGNTPRLDKLKEIFMNCIEKQNNRVYLRGEVVTEKRFSHEVYGDRFYEMDVKVMRLSGQFDLIPVTISERLIAMKSLSVGSTISVIGQFRSYNKLEENHSKLMLTIFVKELVDPSEISEINQIYLIGYICKEPIYRTTPFGREICDVLLAVNRAYNKSDYLPCIAWGRNARFVRDLGVGEKLEVQGRIQSRTYQKRISEDVVETKVAYEISISSVVLVDDVEYVGDYDEYDDENIKLRPNLAEN